MSALRPVATLAEHLIAEICSGPASFKMPTFTDGQASSAQLEK